VFGVNSTKQRLKLSICQDQKSFQTILRWTRLKFFLPSEYEFTNLISCLKQNTLSCICSITIANKVNFLFYQVFHFLKQTLNTFVKLFFSLRHFWLVGTCLNKFILMKSLCKEEPLWDENKNPLPILTSQFFTLINWFLFEFWNKLLKFIISAFGKLSKFKKAKCTVYK